MITNILYCVLSVIQGIALNTGILPFSKGRVLHHHGPTQPLGAGHTLAAPRHCVVALAHQLLGAFAYFIPLTTLSTGDRLEKYSAASAGGEPRREKSSPASR